MAFAGQWKTKTQQPVKAAPLVPGLDPDHLTPENQQDANYVDTTGGPGLPTDVEGGQFEQNPRVPVLYLDQTPVDHDWGVGDLPGVTHAEGRRIGTAMRELDFGAVAAEDYVNPGRREGTYEVQRVQNTDLDGASPATVEIRWDTGVGSPYDLDARSNIRITRWRDRWIDMHWWATEWRALPDKTAKTAPELGYVQNRTSTTVSPYQGNLITDPRNWQTPQERRGTRDWDESMTEDGTAEPLADQMFGLTSWGL
jgi:hypothetical protein